MSHSISCVVIAIICWYEINEKAEQNFTLKVAKHTVTYELLTNLGNTCF